MVPVVLSEQRLVPAPTKVLEELRRRIRHRLFLLRLRPRPAGRGLRVASSACLSPPARARAAGWRSRRRAGSRPARRVDRPIGRRERAAVAMGRGTCRPRSAGTARARRCSVSRPAPRIPGDAHAAIHGRGPAPVAGEVRRRRPWPGASRVRRATRRRRPGACPPAPWKRLEEMSSNVSPRALIASVTLSWTAPLVIRKSAEVPGVTFERASLMNLSSMPTSAMTPTARRCPRRWPCRGTGRRIAAEQQAPERAASARPRRPGRVVASSVFLPAASDDRRVLDPITRCFCRSSSSFSSCAAPSACRTSVPSMSPCLAPFRPCHSMALMAAPARTRGQASARVGPLRPGRAIRAGDRIIHAAAPDPARRAVSGLSAWQRVVSADQLTFSELSGADGVDCGRSGAAGKWLIGRRSRADKALTTR